MDQLIPRTLRRWEDYQSNLCKSAVLSKLQSMTKGHLNLSLPAMAETYSFGYGQKISASIQIHQDRFFQKFLQQGEVGFGASYVEGDWDSPDLVSLLRWFLLNRHTFATITELQPSDVTLSSILQLLGRFHGLLYKSRSPALAEAFLGKHDLERAFFSLFLDSALHNSGAIFAEQDTLEEAQLRKQQRILEELRPQAGDHILELGCGWGSFSLYMAQNFPCQVTAVTVSEEQHQYLVERVAALKLEQRVFPLLQDFRQVRGSFDRIVSIEMIDCLLKPELVQFFSHCDRLLKPQGMMVHQLLLNPEHVARHTQSEKAGFHRYISPGSSTPSLQQLLLAMNQESTFSLWHLEDIGSSYAKTLAAWRQRFEENKATLRAQHFDENFIRAWRYYLAYAEAAFEQGLLTAAQVTVARPSDTRLVH